MHRTILDAQLHEISAGTLQLGTLVTTALNLALQALQSRDLALYSQLIESDKTINDLRFEVERLTFRTLTLQQPLAGRDLRFLSSIPSIVTDLERIGDCAAGIAKLLLLMTPRHSMDYVSHDAPSALANGNQKHQPNDDITEDTIVSKLLDLGREACHVLRETMQAFEQSDAHAARKIWQEDDAVDVRYHLVRHDLMTMLTSAHAIPALTQDETVLQRITYWLWIAHKLERVGDHCTNICERIVYFLERAVMIQPTQTE